MKSTFRKLVIGVPVVITAIAMSGGTAFAFECYNASRSDRGNDAAAASQALVSLDEALQLFCGLSEDEADAIIEQMEAMEFETDFLLNGHALMAGGLERNGTGEEKLHNGQAIDHLTDEFFEALFTLIPSCA